MSNSVKNFYAAIAADYNQMTRFEDRLKSERPVLMRLSDKYNFNSVLDAACGTGLHAIILAQMGLKVYGADISSEMLKQARANAKRAEVDVTWINSPLQHLSRHTNGTFDAIICLGNSIAHLDRHDLKDCLSEFYNLLKPHGYLILQLLNYCKILKDKKRIISINRNIHNQFIRFYDFLDNRIRFNILHIQWGKNTGKHKLTSTLLYPHTIHELSAEIEKSGFCIQDTFGSLNLDEFSMDRSANLVITAQK